MAEPDIAAEGERKRRDGSERGNENMTAGERSKWALIVEGTTLHCGRKSRNEECWSSIALLSAETRSLQAVGAPAGCQ